MKTTKLFAVAFVLMMLGAASVCVLIPQDSNSESSNAIETSIQFYPEAGKDTENNAAIKLINDAQTTGGKASYKFDSSTKTFTLTLDNVAIDSKDTVKAIEIGPYEENETIPESNVVIAINGECKINHTPKMTDSTYNGSGYENTEGIYVYEQCKNLKITGSGSLTINSTISKNDYDASYKCIATNTTGEITASNDGRLALNFFLTNDKLLEDAEFEAIEITGNLTNVDINIKASNIKATGLYMTFNSKCQNETTKKVTFTNCNIVIEGNASGQGVHIGDVDEVVFKDSNLFVKITDPDTSSNGGDDLTCVIEISTGYATKNALSLDNSYILGLSTYGLVVDSDSPNVDIKETNGSFLSFECAKSAIRQDGDEYSTWAAINFNLNLADSELELLGAEKMYDIYEDTKGSSKIVDVSEKKDHAVSLASTDVTKEYSKSTDVFNKSNKKAFIGEKHVLLFVADTGNTFLKNERVGTGDYSFTDITKDGKTYNVFKLGETEYKTGEKYNVADTVAYTTFSCSEKTEPVELTVSITSPEPGKMVTESKITVTGTVTGATKLQYKLNSGTAKDVTFSGTTFSFQIELSPGVNNIDVIAESSDEKAVSEGITVFYNDGKSPFIRELTPSPSEAVKAEKFSIAGKVLNATKVAIILNGGEEKVVTVGEDGSFSTDVTLKSGANSIVVKVYGADGKVAEKTITVTYEKGGDEGGGESFWDTPGNIAGAVVLGFSLLALLGLIVFERTRKL